MTSEPNLKYGNHIACLANSGKLGSSLLDTVDVQMVVLTVDGIGLPTQVLSVVCFVDGIGLPTHVLSVVYFVDGLGLPTHIYQL